MNLNRKQRQVILYGIGISVLLAFLAFLLYSTITDAMSGLTPQEIKDTIISGVITYGGVLFLLLKMIVFAITSSKKLKTSKQPNEDLKAITPTKEVQSVVVKQIASKSVLKNKIGTFNDFDVFMEDNKVLFVSNVSRDKPAYISDMVTTANDLVEQLKKNNLNCLLLFFFMLLWNQHILLGVLLQQITMLIQLSSMLLKVKTSFCYGS